MFNNQQQNNGGWLFFNLFIFFLPASFPPNNGRILQSLELG